MVKQINYQLTCESIISSVMLGDWLSAEKSNDEQKKKTALLRLAQICQYDDFPISELLKLAHKRNKILFFTHQIDIDKLKLEIEEKLTELNKRYSL
ncbi:hypothetical protein [Virgibacillus sp. SK37]|uniref:hypothetical protein n=1 Tax=Virgibacillus sp. SK37 TaxID=403957 RepID=UPI0004D19753|nr:hypothetical protein [Virgibacillus sp. SK37]AIF45398.1 hypothetical protein X953_09960 [Virgibacillus sp. SK37]